MKTAVSQMIKELQEQFPKEMGDMYERNQLLLEDIALRAKEMEKEQQGKFTIDFINWLHLNQYKYNPKAKLYQKQFINQTLFFSIDELFITFKQQEQ
jgi:hypothetical protein